PPTPSFSTLCLHDALPISHFELDSAGSDTGRADAHRGKCRQSRKFRLALFRSEFLGAELNLRRHVLRDEIDRIFPGTLNIDQRVDRKSTRLNSSHVKISYA